MVVITIIGILAAILLPATNAVRRKAATTVTISQMRSVLNGFTMYADEHDNFYPGAHTVTPEGDFKWLDYKGSIYRQVYPNGNAGGGREWSAGAHLWQTVFINKQSVIAFPDNDNLFDHSFCMNASLITDTVGQQSSEPEYSPRNRFLYSSDVQTMLIVEADGQDYNSVQFSDTQRLEDALERNWGKFILVGYMDGSASQMRGPEIPQDPSESIDACYFWTGTDPKGWAAYQQGSGGDGSGAMMDAYRN